MLLSCVISNFSILIYVALFLESSKLLTVLQKETMCSKLSKACVDRNFLVEKYAHFTIHNLNRNGTSIAEYTLIHFFLWETEL